MLAHSLTVRLGIGLVSCVLCLLANADSAEPTQQPPMAHYHHTRINTTDPEKSIRFYETVFNAPKIAYRGKSDVVLVDRAFILFNTVDQPPPRELGSGLYHIGWGCKDTIAEYEWARKHNVQIETPATTIGKPPLKSPIR